MRLVWLEGAREETRLVFTEAERRRPINFRELRGSLRALEVFGERLAGRTVLVELDNTCAHEAVRKLRSKAVDLQELSRRLLDLSLRHGIRLRTCHTPGAMLHRPDQTSRGDAPEEPRVRLRREVFARLEARFGPFTSFLGAEREHSESRRTRVMAGGHPRLWVHPSFTTSASALRLVGEQLTGSPSTCARGLVLLPHAPEAPWWRLTRHLVPVGRLGVGGDHLEENRLGRWVPVRARRDSVVFAFPRATDALTVHLPDLLALGQVSGGDSHGWHVSSGVSSSAPLPAGSLLFSPPYPGEVDGVEQPGTVYLLTEQYDGTGRPACVHLHDGGTAAVARRYREGHSVPLRLDFRSLAPGGLPWRPAVSSLYLVNHLGEPSSQDPSTARPEWAPLSLPSYSSRWRFDLRQALVEVRAYRLDVRRAETRRCEGDPALLAAVAELTLAEGEPAAGDSQEDDSLLPMSGYAERSPPPVTPVRPEAPGTPAGVSSAAKARAGGRRLPRTPTPAEEGLPLTRCVSVIRCGGCGERIPEAAFACRVGAMLTHNSTRCIALQRAKAASAASAKPAEGATESSACPECTLDTAASLPGAGQRAAMGPPACAGLPGVSRTGGGPTPPAEAEGVAAVQGKAGPVPRTGSDQRRAQLAANLGPGRRDRVRACLAGTCGVTGETPMECLTCARTLHGVGCAGITKGFASVGCFTCPQCLLGKLAPTLVGPPSDPVVEMCETKCLVSLTMGAEATGGGFADLIKLLGAFRESLGDLVGALTSPLDDPDVFQMFLLWLITKKGRALSLDTLWRTAGSLMGRTGRENLTRHAEVKAFYRELRVLHGEEGHPRTATTPGMIFHLFDSVIDRQFDGKPLLRARARLLMALEVMCGLRVGEVLGGGDGHGLLANHVVLLRNLRTGAESVECLVEHSKTKFRRWVNAVATSEGEGRVPLAQCVRDYWREGGFEVSSWNEGGFAVTGPDYSVVRVSLVGLGVTDTESKARLEALCDLLDRSRSPEVRRHASTSRTKARERFAASTSMDKRYVNVVGGMGGRPVYREDGSAVVEGMSKEISTVVAELAKAGFSGTDRVTIVPGPLVRASSHGGKVQSHMPWVPSSSYDHLHEMLGEAHLLAGGLADPQLDLQGLAKPLWGHHSNRRGSDTIARATMSETGATEQDIDLTYGWREAMYSHIMQVHYESKFDREKRTAVTRMV